MTDELRAMLKRLETIKTKCADAAGKSWATDPATARAWATLHADIFETLKMVAK
jgi:hypothetical protein